LKRLESKQVTIGNNPVLKKLDSIDEWLCSVHLYVFIQSPNGDCIHGPVHSRCALVREKIFKYSRFLGIFKSFLIFVAVFKKSLQF
jgi:hypothetical protein